MNVACNLISCTRIVFPIYSITSYWCCALHIIFSSSYWMYPRLIEQNYKIYVHIQTCLCRQHHRSEFLLEGGGIQRQRRTCARHHIPRSQGQFFVRSHPVVILKNSLASSAVYCFRQHIVGSVSFREPSRRVVAFSTGVMVRVKDAPSAKGLKMCWIISWRVGG